MKNNFTKHLVSVVVLILSCLFAKAQYTTPTINGAIGAGEYGTHTDGQNQQTNAAVITYCTWDATNLYIGVSGANISEGFVMYLDKDPQVPVNGGGNANGTNVGNTYDGTNFAALQFRADVVMYVKNGYREYRTADGSNGWSGATTAFGSYSDAGSIREFSFPWSAIGGIPASFNFFNYVTSSGGFVYGQTPTVNAGGSIGTTARYQRYYTVSSTANGTSTKPFSRESYVFNLTFDDPTFGAITVYDYTMNTSGRSLTRGGGGNWNITGNLVVGAGTINFEGAAAFGTTAISTVNLLGGTLSMNATTNPMNVSGNVSIAAGATLALSSAVGGDLNIGGDFTNNGTFTANSRAVSFNGSGGQGLYGASTTFAYLNISNTANQVQNFSIPNLTVNNQLNVIANAALATSSGTTLTLGASCVSTINGSIFNAGVISNSGTLTFTSTGTFFHLQNGGTIPTSTWNSGSLCQIGFITNTVPTGLNQSFGNFTWNSSTQTANVNLGGLLTSVANDLNITSTNGFDLQLISTGTSTLNITGNLFVGGILNLTSSTGNAIINISGNLTNNGTLKKSGSGSGTINFVNASSTQTFSQSSGTISGNISWNVGTGASTNSVQLSTNINLGTGTGGFTVLSNASLICGTRVMSGSGPFTTSANSSLLTGNANGISSSGATGSIQVSGARTFSSTGNYTYNGSIAQITGDGLPGTIRSLTVNITGGNALNLTSSLIVTNALTLTSGKVNLLANTIDIGGSTLTGGSSTSYIVADPITGGKLYRTVAGVAKLFPVGNSNYNPITLTNSGISDSFGVSVSDANASTGANDATKQVNRNWQIFEAAAGGSNLSIVAQYNTADGAGTNFAAGSNPKIGLHDGTSWTEVSATAGGANPFTYTSTANIAGPSGLFFMIGLGKDDAFLPTIPGAALNFDGVDDYVVTGNCPNLPMVNSARTMEAWIKTTTAVGQIFAWGINSINQRSGIAVIGSKLYFTGQTNDLQGNISVDDGNWHHVAITFDGTTMNLYVDGVLDVSAAKTLNTSTSTLLYVGARPGGTLTFFNGSIDEVRIWNIARTQADIQANMNCEIAAQAGLVASYHFNQGIGGANNSAITSLTDASGNVYDGTLQNLTLTGSTSNWVTSGGVVSGTSCPANCAGTPSAGSAATSNASVCSGSNFTLSLTGNSVASGLTYQWQSSSNIGGPYTNISGATLATLLTNQTSATYYRCDVTCTNSSQNNISTPVLVSMSTSTTSVASGNWNSAATWSCGVPTSGMDVTIAAGHSVTLDVTPITVGTLTIAATGSLDLGNSNNTVNVNSSIINSGTLTVGNAFVYFNNAGAVLTNTGTFTQTGGEISFQSTGTINGTISIYYLTLHGGVTLSSTNVTVSNTLLMMAGGFIAGGNSPNYSVGSTLQYHTAGSYTAGLEWATNSTSGNGIPSNVSITNGSTALNFGASGAYRYLSKNLYIDDGCSLTLSSNIGGDLKLAGDFSVAATGTFNPNSRAVFFEGVGNKTIKKFGGGSVTFAYLVHNSSGNIQQSSAPATNVIINGAGGDILQLLSTGSYDINGQSLNLNGATAANVSIGASGTKNIVSTSPNGFFSISNSTKTVTTTGTATLVFGSNVIISLSNGFNFGSNLSTVNYYLSINNGGFVSTNPPNYGASSTLEYSIGGSYTAGAEWATNLTSGTGVPYKVNLTNNTTLSFGASAFFRATQGDLSFAAAGNTLTLSTASGGNLKIAGNLIYTGTGTDHIVANQRTVFFIGGNVQTFTWPTSAQLDYLVIDKTGGSITATSAGSNFLRLKGTGTDSDILALTNGNLSMGTGTALTFANTTAKNINIGLSGTRTLASLNASGPGSLTITTSGATQINLTGVTLAAQIDFGANLSTITTSLAINSGGSVVNNGPAYSGSSTLTYNTGTLTRGAEWSATSGYGYPNAVTVSSGATLNYGVNVATAAAIASTFNIQATATVNMNSPANMTANTQVASLLLSGTLNLSGASGGTFTTLNGNITINGTLNQNGNDFIINGSTNCVIGGSNAKFGKLQYNRTGVAAVHTANIYVCELTIGAASNFVVQNGKTLIVDVSLYSFLTVGPPPPPPSGFIIKNGSLNFLGTGYMEFQNGNVTFNGSSPTTFKKVSLDNATALFTTTSYTINDTLALKNASSFDNSSIAPSYGASSYLIYSGNGSISRGKEWSSFSGAGCPQNVIARTNTQLQFATTGLNENTPVKVIGNFTIEGGSTVNLNTGGQEYKATLTIGGKLFVGNVGIGTLILSNSGGGEDVDINSDISVTAGSTLTCNISKFVLKGTTEQNISILGTGDFYYLDFANSGGAKLLSNITVTNELEFNNSGNGDLDLNNFNVTLGSSATIQGEDNNSKIINTAGSIVYGQGYIGYTKTVNSPNLSDGSNLGLHVFGPGVNLGLVTVRRYVQPISSVGLTSSMNRVYELILASALNCNVRMDYNTTELNGNTATEGIFQIFNSTSFNIGANYSLVTPTYLNPLNSPTNIPLIAGSNYFTAAQVSSTPLTGIVNVPSDYATVEDAIDAVNTNGVGLGGATINIASGTYTLGNIIIDIQNNAPTPTNPLIISGPVSDPPLVIFNARPGGTIDRDAVVKVVGTGNVTLQYITFNDPPVNDDNFERMEWGIALLKKASNDACQNVNIKHCSINLQNADTVSTGIYMGNHSYDPTQLFTVNAASGNFDNITIQANNIKKVNKGIILKGFNDPSYNLLEKHIYIGDTITVANGNTFSNLGGNATPTIGIHLGNPSSFIIGNNSFDNTSNGGTLALGDIRGVSVTGNSSGYSVIASNYLSLKQATTSLPMYGINNELNSSNAYLNIRNNKIQSCSKATNSTGEFHAIRNGLGEIYKIQMDGNRIVNNTSINTNASVFGISNTSTTERIYILNDTIRDFASSTTGNMYAIYNPSGADSVVVDNVYVSQISKTGNGGALYGYLNDATVGFAAMVNQTAGNGFQTLAAFGVERVVNSTFRNMTVVGITPINGITSSGRPLFNKVFNLNKVRILTAQNGDIHALTLNGGNNVKVNDNKLSTFNGLANIYGLDAVDGTSLTIDNDSVYNISQGGAGSAFGIYHTTTSSGGHTKTITNNDISNISKSTGIGAVYALAHDGTGNGSTNFTVNTNSIDNITQNGTGPCYGIYHTGSGTGGPHTISNLSNIVNGVSNSAGPAYGIYHTGSGTGGPHTVSNLTNTVTNVSASGGGNAYGIYHTGSGTGGPHTITENGNNLNFISSSSTGEAYGIFHDGTSNTSQTNSRVGNIVSNVSASGSGNAFGIYHTGSGTGGPHTGIVRNNIVDVVSSSTGASYGIYHTGSGTGGPHTSRVSDNEIKNLSSSTNTVTGIKLADLDSLNLNKNVIKQLSTTSGIIEGLNINSTLAQPISGIVSNSLIGDFTTFSSNSVNSISGINVNGTSGTSLKFYYNTVYIAASSIGGSFGSNALLFSDNVPVELRNNIFINKSNSTSGGGVRVLSRTGAFSPTFLNTSNNNAYFVADSTNSNNLIYKDAGNSIQNFSAYRAFTGFEAASFAENVNFVSTSGASANFLKIDPSIATRIESGGSASNLGVLTDVIGSPRFGALGYVGLGTATDIGAYEGNYATLAHRWLGLFSNDWSNPLNWTGSQLPDNTMDIVISAAVSPQPSISVTNPACRQIQLVSSGATNPTITIASGRTLTIEGNLIGSGTFAGLGKIIIAAPGVAQSSSGNIVATNVDVNNSMGLTLSGSGSLKVNRELGLISGVVTTTLGNLTIGSSASATGLINDFSPGYSGSISGNARIQRYIPTTIQAAHYISSPVTNGLTVFQNYSDNFTVAGIPSAYIYNTDPTVTQPTLFPTTWWFDETLTGATIPGWRNGINKIMTPGLAISANIPQLRTIDVVGAPFTGTLNYPITFTDNGYNFIGNPYVSPLSLNDFLTTNASSVYPFVYVWNVNKYSVYSSGGGVWTNNPGAGSNDRIGHSQSFLAISQVPTGNVTFTNTMRKTSQAYTYFQTPQNICRIEYNDGIESDEAIVRLDEQGSDYFDKMLDANKIITGMEQQTMIFTSSKDNYSLAINSIKDFDEDRRIPLAVIGAKNAKAHITFSELASIDASVNVYLEDNTLGVIQDMRVNNSYEANVSQGNNGDRFNIVFSKQKIENTGDFNTGTFAYANGKNLFLNLNKFNGNCQLKIFNNLGQLVEYRNISGNSGSTVNYNFENLSGSYVVQLINNGQMQNAKVVFGQ